SSTIRLPPRWALTLAVAKSATGSRAGSNCALSAATAATSAAAGVLPEATGTLGSATGAFCSVVSTGCAGAVAGADDGEQAASRPATIIAPPHAYMRITDLT